MSPFASSRSKRCAVTLKPRLCASSMTAPYISGVSFLYLPSRLSTQILTMSTLCAAASSTALRPSPTEVIPYPSVLPPAPAAATPPPPPLHPPDTSTGPLPPRIDPAPEAAPHHGSTHAGTRGVG